MSDVRVRADLFIANVRDGANPSHAAVAATTGLPAPQGFTVWSLIVRQVLQPVRDRLIAEHACGHGPDHGCGVIMSFGRLGPEGERELGQGDAPNPNYLRAARFVSACGNHDEATAHDLWFTPFESPWDYAQFLSQIITMLVPVIQGQAPPVHRGVL